MFFLKFNQNDVPLLPGSQFSQKEGIVTVYTPGMYTQGGIESKTNLGAMDR